MNNNFYYAKLAKNKSLLKEYKTSFCDRTVYLNDGDEFQFQLFNPEREEIAVRIYIESCQLSHDIVLRPGERIWVERYTDTPKKFRFNTYYVNGKSKEVQEAIADNGEIRIEFFHKKKNEPIWVNTPNITWTYLNNASTGWKPYNDNLIYCGATNAANSINTVSTSLETINCQNLTDINSSISLASCDNVLYSSPSSSFAATNVEENTKLETGRVMEGGHSNQKFNDVNIDFEYFSFRTETIKILPESRKPYNANDLRKMYCPNCGRKLKNNYKFCPYCGQKID